MRIAALLLVAALFGGCDPSAVVEQPDRGEPTVSVDGGARVDELPAGCRPWTGEPSRAEITFAKDGRLFALDPVTEEIRCIGRKTSYGIAWGARGDRLLLASGLSMAYSDSFHNDLPGDQRETTWSRPTGTSVVYISHDFSGLLKEEVTTGTVTDISFLEEHHDVAYHSAGTHIAVSGSTSDGEVGLYLATNEGTDIQQIVRGERARFIDRLTFSHDGRHLYFHADHDGHHDLHAVRLATGEQTGDAERELRAADLKTVLRAIAWVRSPCHRSRVPGAFSTRQAAGRVIPRRWC